MFERFLEAQPKVVVFGELAPGGKLSDTPLSAAEEELLAKLGISREQFSKYAV